MHVEPYYVLKQPHLVFVASEREFNTWFAHDKYTQQIWKAENKQNAIKIATKYAFDNNIKLGAVSE